MKYCQSCGKELADNALSCPGCGFSFSSKPKRIDSYAIASFILGLLYLKGMGSILAVIFGFMALKRIKTNPGLSGAKLAIWGIILGFFLGFALPLLGLLIFGSILLPHFIHPHLPWEWMKPVKLI